MVFFSFVHQTRTSAKEVLLNYIPFCVSNSQPTQVGYIHRENVQLLKSVFLKEYRPFSFQNATLESNEDLLGEIVVLTGSNFEERTNMIGPAVKLMHNMNILKYWRSELYPVVEWNKQQNRLSPEFIMERAASNFFGIGKFCIHVNGYRRNEMGQISHIWIATRAPTKHTYPNAKDTLVAGGVPYGHKLRETAIRECHEEAHLQESFVEKNLISSGCVGIAVNSGKMLDRETIFEFDIEIPPNVIPEPLDGEVSGFQLVRTQTVLQMIATPSVFMPGAGISTLNFFIRKGLFDVEDENYYNLVTLLSTCRAVPFY